MIDNGIMDTLALIETVIATVIVAYVLIRYVMAIARPIKS